MTPKDTQIMKSMKFTATPLDTKEYFTRTTQLRWKQSTVFDGAMLGHPVLQQLYNGSKGTQKWEDVPFAQEDKS